MRFLLLCFLIVFTFELNAQEPAWLSSSSRSSQFPQSQYLQGYAWQSNVKKDVEEVYNRLTAQAKSELIEAIQVEVQASSELQTKEIQDEFMSRFSSNTKTTAKANIVGMKVEKYFDKKSKSAYVFAYANKNEIADYYLNEISEAIDILEKSLEESQSFMEQNLAKESMVALLSENKQYKRINESRNFLKALGVRSSSGLKTEALAEVIKARETQVNTILLNNKASTDALAYFLVSELSDKHGVNVSNAQIKTVSYSDTPLKSTFSNKLASSLQNALGDVKVAPEYQRMNESSVRAKFEEDDEQNLKVTLLVDAGSSSFSSEARFSKSAAEKWEPEGVKFLKNMNAYVFIPQTTLLEANCLERIKEDLRVEVVYGSGAAAKFPLALNNSSTGEITTTIADDKGIAYFKALKVNACKPVQILFIEPDLSKLLQLEKNDPYIARVRKEFKIPAEKLILRVNPTLVYLNSKELYDGSPMSVKAIEPLVKEKLSLAGFELTSDVTKARFQIDIQATARKGGNIQGLYFSYLDAALTVIDLESGSEIINQAFSGEKQGGSNFEQAAMNAFKKTGEQMLDALSGRLFND